MLSGGSSLDHAAARLEQGANYNKNSKSSLLPRSQYQDIYPPRRGSTKRAQQRPQYQIVAMAASQDKGRTLSNQYHNVPAGNAHTAIPSTRGKLRKKAHQRKNSIQKQNQSINSILEKERAYKFKLNKKIDE